MSIFDAYCEEFQQLRQQLSNEIKNEYSSSSAERNRKIENLLFQMNDLVKQANIEVRSLPQNERQITRKKLDELKVELQQMQADYNASKDNGLKSELLGMSSEDYRRKMTDTHSKSKQSNELILNAIKTSKETEDIGAEISSDIGRNNEKIESARNKAQEVSGITDSAQKILKRMDTWFR